MRSIVTYAALAALLVVAPVSAQGDFGTSITLEPSIEGLPGFEELPVFPRGRLQFTPEEIEDFLDPFRQTMPADPFDTPRKLDDIVLNLQELCDGGFANSCREAVALRAAKERLLVGANANIGCVAAADAMLGAYSLGNPTEQVARDYDLNCLGAFVARPGEPSGLAAQIGRAHV